MKTLCPTCSGKGSINDPKCLGRLMMYCGPNGEACPQITCQTCSGTGWISNFYGGVYFPPEEQPAGEPPVREITSDGRQS